MSQRNFAWQRIRTTERLHVRDAHGKRWLLQVYDHTGAAPHHLRGQWLVRRPGTPNRVIDGLAPTIEAAKLRALAALIQEIEQGRCPLGRRTRMRLEHFVALLALGGAERA